MTISFELETARADKDFSWNRRITKKKNPETGQVKRRVIYEPSEDLHTLHRIFYQALRRAVQERFEIDADVYRGLQEKVRLHRHNRYFYLIDIKDAFPSVQTEKMVRALKNVFPWESMQEMRLFLERFCIAQEGGLMQGMPSSDDLFDLYMRYWVDASLIPLCERHGVTYTRLTDDLTFSAKSPIGEHKRRQIRQCIERVGLTINHRKAQIVDLREMTQRGKRFTINGVGLEYGGRIFLPRRYLRKMRGLILKALKTEDPKLQKKLLQKIAGFKGLFWAVTDYTRPLNHTELKLVELLNELEQQHGWNPSGLGGVSD